MSREKVINEKEKAALLALISEHGGNISAIARALGLKHRQTAACRLEKYGLSEAADQARAESGVSGPRISLAGGVSLDPTGEKITITDAIALHGGYRQAAKALGISPRTIARRMRSLRVTPASVLKRRKELGIPA